MSILSDELALPAYDGLSDEAATSLLNTKNIPALKNIQTSDIRQYLMLNNIWLELKRSTSGSAEMARDALAEFDSFTIADSSIIAVITAILDGLIADASIPSFTETAKADILAMGDILISRAEQLGLSLVKVGHIEQTRAI